MRIVRIVIVLLVLIGFPLISWIYLSSGLKWRLDVQEETTRKDTLIDFALTLRNGTPVSAEDLKGWFYVIASPRNDTEYSRLARVQEQFGVREDFRTLLLLHNDATPSHDTLNAWMEAHCTDGCAGLIAGLFPDESNAAIVDDKLWVRGQYDLAREEEVRRLIKHMAVVLPIEKREELELKRGGDKN